jgi:hypothetical protein
MTFSIRLVLCCNDCAIGSRLSRGTPMPVYQQSYDDTPEGRLLAEHHLGNIKKYIDDYEQRKQKRK